MAITQIQSGEQVETSIIQADEIASKLTTPLAWLTGERLLFLCIVAIAVTTRFAILTHYPLNNAEASQSFVGFTIFEGDIPIDAANYSPLMASLNSLTFFIFSPSDMTARFGAVVLGIILVMLPYGLRSQLGTLEALIAALLLALSASVLYWARQNTGDIGVATGLMMVIFAGVRWLEKADRFPVFMAIGGAVVLLLSAPSQFTVWVIIALLIIYLLALDRELGINVMARLRRSGLTSGQLGLTTAGLVLLVGTTALFNLTGLAAIADLFNSWLGQFSLIPQANVVWPALLLLVFYEPLIVLFGLVGVYLSFKNRRPFDQLLVIGFGLAILLDLLMSGRQGGQMLVPLVPLALLASRPIASILTGFWTKGQLEIEGLFVCFGLVLVSFVYISLVSWSKCMPDVAIPGCETAWLLPPAGILLIVVWFIMFWQYYTLSTALQGLGILGLVVAGVLSIGANWRLNYGPLKDLPLQPLVAEAPSTRFVTLLDDISRISAEERSDPTQIDIAIIGLDTPALRWYLREFPHVRYAAGFAGAPGASLILAPAEAGQPFEPNYAGQDYALTSQWSPLELVGKQWLRWYLFRFLAKRLPVEEEVVLWVRQ